MMKKVCSFAKLNVMAVKPLHAILLTLLFFASCSLSGIFRLSSEENVSSVSSTGNLIHNEPIVAIDDPIPIHTDPPMDTNLERNAMERGQRGVGKSLKALNLKADLDSQAPACPIMFNAPGHFSSNQRARLAALNEATQLTDSGGNTCQPELISYLIRTVNGPEDERPQLNFDQLMWIGITVAESRASISNSLSCLEPESEGTEGCRHNFLVWGMGRDSHIWMNANCIPEDEKARGKVRTRTVFFENYASWFKSIRGKFPSLEGYLVEYKGMVGRADEFFQNPYVMKVPDTVKDTCFSVALVDGPQGFAKSNPGRMEAAYWSLNMAKRCLTEKKLDVVHIFLHDVGRSVEKEIMKRFFHPNSQFLGFVDGNFGELAGFRLTRSTLQVEGRVRPTE